MLIRNIKEFLESTIEKRIVCLDIGKKNIGVAISDQNHLIVSPLDIIKKNKFFIENILNVITSFNVGGILIGIPVNSTYKNQSSSQMIKDLTKNIDIFLVKNNYELPIFFWDESYTSLEAEDLTKNIFKKKKKQKNKLDKFAAKIILDDFFRENLD